MAQSEAQSNICPNLSVTFGMEKVAQNFEVCTYMCNFQKSPHERKFSQSGHPDREPKPTFARGKNVLTQTYRVTKLVCEKFAQNVAQHILCLN
jgi:hypothetical protein